MVVIIRRIAIRAITIFALMIGVVGGVVGVIVGIGYLIFLINKHFNWGPTGVAIMTVVAAFGVASILIAVSDVYYDGGGQEG